MTLFRHGRIERDDWSFPDDDSPIPRTERVAVPLARFLAERQALLQRPDPSGVILIAGDGLDGIAADTPRLGLIALGFPRYTDGRPYSLARLLRDRHGFTGELRATGNVLRDQIGFMLRSGFDAFDVTHAGTITALSEFRIVTVRDHYQPASRTAAESHPGGRAWLRRSADVTRLTARGSPGGIG